MKLTPNELNLVDPTFWTAVPHKVKVTEKIFISGSVERKATILARDGRKSEVVEHAPPLAGGAAASQGNSPAIQLQAAVNVAALKVRRKGATAAIRAVMPRVAELEQQISALHPGAHQKATEQYRRYASKTAARTNAMRRERLFRDIRLLAAEKVIEREELGEAWDLGAVQGVLES